MIAEEEAVSAVRSLLDIDEANVRMMLAELTSHAQGVIDTLDMAASIFDTFAHAFGAEQGQHHGRHDLVAWGKELARLPPGPDQLLRLRDALGGDERTRYVEQQAGRVRMMLLLHMRREYLLAVGELMRLRIVSTQAHLRPEIEAAALAAVVASEPAAAVDWLCIADDRAGRRFSSKHRKKIDEFTKKYGLEAVWNHASGAAQHARLASVAHGFGQRTFVHCGQVVTEMTLTYQDFPENEPEQVLLWLIHVADMQCKLFSSFVESYPEAQDLILIEQRLPRYFAAVERLWGGFDRSFPGFGQNLLGRPTR